MKLRVISSNSSGNAYLFFNDQEALLVECGVRFDRIKQALGYNLRKLAGCLVSHEHQDHCRAVTDVMAAGIPVYASAGTHEAMGTKYSHRARVMQAGKQYKVGGFQVKGFDIRHDTAEPFGFLIWHEETGLVLFLTDTIYSEYRFQGLSNILIEANYSQEILDARTREGENPKFLRDRVIESHMNIETCKEALLANDLSGVQNIVLIHLSDGNSDAMEFQREITEVTGKTVWVADRDMTIDLNKEPF